MNLGINFAMWILAEGGNIMVKETVKKLVLMTVLIFLPGYTVANVICPDNGCQNFVRLSEDGRGDLLFFPIFYVDKSSYTRIVITNTSKRFGVIAQVTVKSAGCAESMANFIIYLTPYDTWVGYLKMEKNKVSVVSYDNSIILKKKPASNLEPAIIVLNSPQNPKDITQVGYIEVKTSAYVDTYYISSDNVTESFYHIMRSNGFTEEHMFIKWLYGTGSKYNDIAYFSDNNTVAFTGIIFPADEHEDFYKNNPMVRVTGGKKIVNTEIEDGTLFGKADLVIEGYGVASYQAVAIKDFVMLGDDTVINTTGEAKDYNEAYKPSLDNGTWLDAFGCIENLDVALAKHTIDFHYVSDKVDPKTFMILLFPTKQLAYDSDTQRCIATEHTSEVWHEGLFLEQQGIDIISISDSGEQKRCAFSPCIWSNTAMISIGKTLFGFDPFIYKSGWVHLLFYSTDESEIYKSPDEKTGVLWKNIEALPVIAIGGVVTEYGISVYYPSFKVPERLYQVK